MKCKICKGKTNWDKSYGYWEFIVCPKCHDELCKVCKSNYMAWSVIIKMGRLAREGKNDDKTEKDSIRKAN